MMRSGRSKRDEFSAGKYRFDDENIGDVHTTAFKRIIHYEQIARVNVITEFFEQGGHGRWHSAQMQWNCYPLSNHLPVCIAKRC